MPEDTHGFISPDEFKAKCEELMLDGREAQSRDDWLLIINCMAVNAPEELAMSICHLMAVIYEAPVEEEMIEEIVQFQLAKKGLN
jgi:hypothetical protein